MSALERFQAEHGATWAATTQSPAFIAAFTLANIERLQAVAALTDEEIATHGQIILADLRGHLKYETALISLHEKKEFVFQDMPRETYPDPVTEAAEEEAAQHSSESTTAHPESLHFVPETPLPEKPKRKYRRSKKRK